MDSPLPELYQIFPVVLRKSPVMKQFLQHIFYFSFLLLCTACNGQVNNSDNTEPLSSDFDEQMPFAYKMPEQLSSEDYSPSWNKDGQNIRLTGKVYESDGTTPADSVILYYYQTNSDGIYATKPDEERNMPENKLGQTHGYIRGWIKTGNDGRYTIHTTLPGSYPGSSEPAHIHMTIQENNDKEPYYIDDFVFDQDPLLTEERRNRKNNRGGSGIIELKNNNELKTGHRDIYLGRNIPGYK